MKLYKLTQNERRGYDTYDSCVVCAENEREAKKIHPNDYMTNEPWWKTKGVVYYSEWATRLKYVNATYIGEADESLEKGVIIASFNAG